MSSVRIFKFAFKTDKYKKGILLEIKKNKATYLIITKQILNINKIYLNNYF